MPVVGCRSGSAVGVHPWVRRSDKLSRSGGLAKPRPDSTRDARGHRSPFLAASDCEGEDTAGGPRGTVEMPPTTCEQADWFDVLWDLASQLSRISESRPDHEQRCCIAGERTSTLKHLYASFRGDEVPSCASKSAADPRASGLDRQGCTRLGGHRRGGDEAKMKSPREFQGAGIRRIHQTDSA